MSEHTPYDPRWSSPVRQEHTTHWTPYDEEMETVYRLFQQTGDASLNGPLEHIACRKEGYLRALQDTAAEREAVQRLERAWEWCERVLPHYMGDAACIVEMREALIAVRQAQGNGRMTRGASGS